MANTLREIIMAVLESTEDKEEMADQLVNIFEDYEPAELGFFLVFNPGMQARKVKESDVKDLPQNWVVVPKSNKVFYGHDGHLLAAYRHLKTWRP